MVRTYAVRRFLTFTFFISLIAFALIALVPGARTPESAIGLPVWLLAVWSPTLAAGWLLHRDGRLRTTLRARLGAFPPPVAWALVTLPFLVAGALLLTGLGPSGHELDASALTPATVSALVAFNLVLGPLGEELGWRGYLLPAWEPRLGRLAAALGVGAVWAAWHAPLWLVDSPQRDIPFAIFVVHVIAYSVIMARAQHLARGSLWPAILLHLGFNVVAALAVIVGAFDVPGWYAASASLYALVALCLAFAPSSERSRGPAAPVPRAPSRRPGAARRSPA